ncbi:MAG: hypothetical protein IK091_05630, partial [Spirochaetales bacterium]|nr:hypothetical protein [Spirochaetales bacterium]
MNAALNFAVFSLSMAAATVLLFVLSRLAGKRFSSRCKYALWAVIVIRMCLPLTFLPTLMTYETAYVSETAEEISPEAAFVAPSSASASAGPGTSDEGTPTARSDASAVGHEKKQTPKIPNADVLIPAAYFVISALIFSAQLSMYGISMRKMRRSLREPDKKTVKKYLRIAEEEGVRRAPALFVSDLVSGPLLCGFFRRKIVITEAA